MLIAMWLTILAVFGIPLFLHSKKTHHPEYVFVFILIMLFILAMFYGSPAE